MSKTTQRTQQLDEARQDVQDLYTRRRWSASKLIHLQARLSSCERFLQGITLSTDFDEITRQISEEAAIRILIKAGNNEIRTLDERFQRASERVDELLVEQERRHA